MRFCGHRREAVRHQVPFCTPPKTVRAPVLSGRRTDDESRLPSSTITKAMPDADTHEKLAPFRRLVARFSLSETAKYTKLALGLWIGFAIPSVLGFPDAALSLAGSAMFTLALESSISAARSYFHKRVLSNVVAMPLGRLLIWLPPRICGSARCCCRW
jgi:hypothetical protein